MTAAVIVEHDVTVHQGHVLDVLPTLAAGSVQCVVTSPPYYGLRDYGTEPIEWPEVTFTPVVGLPPITIPAMAASFGLEPDSWAYVAHFVLIARELHRIVRDDGVLWLNLGDSYVGAANSGGPSTTQRGGNNATGRAGEAVRITGLPTKGGMSPKNLIGIPWRVAFALQDDGWTLRNAIIWHKTNAMPESVTDRLSTRYEHMFLFSKSRRYWFDLDPIRESRSAPTEARYKYAFKPNSNPASSTNHLADGGMMTALNDAGRNPGDVWTIPTSPFPGAHFATMPPELARRCILAGCPDGGTVLDPFAGSGTTLKVARSLGRNSVGIELNPDYIDIIRERIGQTPLDFGVTA